MAVFQYTALDAQGVEIKNEIEALSQKEAISKIRNMGYFPTKVAPRGGGKKTASNQLPAAKEKTRCRRQSKNKADYAISQDSFLRFRMQVFLF